MTSPGHNVLIPSPGFPAYETLLGNIENCEIRTYDCLPDKGWECDVEQMERLIDEKTSFILVVSRHRYRAMTCGSVAEMDAADAFRPTLATRVGTTCGPSICGKSYP